MKSTVLLVRTMLLFSMFYIVNSYRILLLTPMGSKSHKIFFNSIVEALANKGHHITIVSAYKNSKEMKNVRDVVIPSDILPFLKDIFAEGAADELIKNLIVESPALCNECLAIKEVQDLKKEKFDAIMLSLFFDYCFLSFVHHFKVPLIYMSPAGLFGPFVQVTGNVDFPSFVPSLLLDATFPPNFKQRLQTLVLNNILANTMPFYIYPRTEKICREKGLCPPDMPPLNDISNNMSLVILNSMRTLERPPRPTMPNTIYAGGAHLKPGKPLSQELENWIRGAGDAGFIFFSLGSAVPPSQMPEKYRKILINVFGNLKQRVLWKWDEETMPDLPLNVKLSKWLPQQDILAHKKLRIFITHGGLLSTMESTYHGVPIIGMPVFADQYANIKEASNQGWAKVQKWSDLTESSFKNAINEILINPKLRLVSQERSQVMKDVFIDPAEEAAFWVEYVIRHRGAEHLKSPLFNMSWYEIHNIDVWAVIITTLSLVLYILFRIFRAIARFCFGSNKNKKKRD